MEDIKLAIVGSRSFLDEKYSKHIKTLLDNFKRRHTEYNIIEVISGGAKGVDTYAEEWANENNININIIKPEWNKYGKSAGFIRNEEIIKSCDICIAFWDGVSKGTHNAIELCKKFYKPLYIWQNEFGENLLYNKNAKHEEGTLWLPMYFEDYTPTITDSSIAPKILVNSKYALVDAGFNDTKYYTFQIGDGKT